LKRLLEDAEKGIKLNKTMIGILVQHQENQHGASRHNMSASQSHSISVQHPGVGGVESAHLVIERLNEEHQDLRQQLSELRK